MSLSITRKLTGAVAIGAIAAGVITTVGYTGLSSARAELDHELVATSVVKNEMQIDMMHDGIRADMLMLRSSSGDADRSSAITGYEEHRKSALDNIAANEQLAVSGALHDAVAQGKAAFTEYLAAADTFVKAVQADPAAAPSAYSTFQAAFEKAEETLAGVGDTMAAVHKEAVDSAKSDIDHQHVLLVIVSVLMIAVLSGALGRLAVTLSRRLRRVEQAFRRVAGKDLTVTVDDEFDDELGHIATAANETVATMRSALGSIRVNAEGLTVASERLAAVSQQVGASAAETSTQVGSASGASKGVAEHVGTVAVATSEMSASVREIALSATDAANVAREAVSITDETTTTITQLGDSSSAIASVVDIIKSIAEQTNLLALNATIEAARAGETGRGFAVVANEVKNLAQETARATNDIRDKIDAIRNDSDASVAAIGHIGDVIRRIDAISSTIAAAVEEQAATTDEIVRSLDDATRGTSQITDTMANVATAADHSAEAANHTRSAAQELLTMAHGLSDLVNQFDLG